MIRFMFRPSLFTICSLLTLGVFSASVMLVDAAPKKKRNKRAKKGALAQLDQEVRTVKVNSSGSKGSFAEVQKAVHVLYSTETMEAFIDTTGDLYIQPLVAEPNGAVSGAMKLDLGLRYAVKVGEYSKTKAAKTSGMISSATPGKNPKEVTITFDVDRGAKGTAVYSFDGKSIEVEFEVEDPKGLESPTRTLLGLKVPLSHELAIDASDKVKKKATDGCLLEINKKKYDYTTPYKRASNTKGGAGSVAGHWPGYKIKVAGKPGLGFSVYGAALLHKGYTLEVGSRDKPSVDKSIRIEVLKAP